MKERWLGAVQSRLARVTALKNLAPVLEPDAITEAQSLAGQLSEGEDFSARFLLGWLYWYRYQALPSDNDEDLTALFTAVAMFLPCQAVRMTGLPEPLLPVLTGQRQAIAVARKMLQRVLDTGDETLLVPTATLWRRIVNAVPADDVGRAGHQANLGTALLAVFRRTGGPPYLDEAVETLQAAADSLPADHADGPGTYSALGVALLERFQRSGVITDLDAAVSAGQSAVRMATLTSHPERAHHEWNLGNALYARFEQAGDAADLELAVASGRCALEATSADDPNRAAMAASLARRLQALLPQTVEQTVKQPDPHALAAAVQDALQAPSGPAQNDLCVRLLEEYERTGDMADLVAAVTSGQAAVTLIPVGDTGRPVALSNLAAALLARSTRTGTLSDLDDALAAAQEALHATPARHRDRSQRLHNLGTTLLARFVRTDAQPDLDAAIEAWLGAVGAAWPDDPARAAALDGLDMALTHRFKRNAVMADADAAIVAGRTAVEATRPGDPNRPGFLSNLGNALLARFDRAEKSADLDAAIEAMRGAVETGPDHRGHALFLSNLGNALRTRYLRAGTRADLDAAIEYGGGATAAIAADDPRRAGALSNLGNVLLRRFQEFGARTDLDAAVDRYQAAVAAAATDDPERALFLSNLGNALRTRFVRAGAAADLDAAIEYGRAAVEAVAADHPGQELYLSALGATLRVWLEGVGAQFEAAQPASAGAPDAPAVEVDGAALLALQFWRERSPPTSPDEAGWTDLVLAAHDCVDRFDRTGLLLNLDQAVRRYRAALAVAPAAALGRIQHELGNALQSRYQRTGDTDSLKEAVQAARAAVAAVDESNRPYALAALGAALRQVAEQSTDTAASTESVAVLRAAAESVPDESPQRFAILGGLSNALRTSYRGTGDTGVLAEAVAVGRAASAAVPVEDASRGWFLSNFSGLLYEQYQRTGDAAVLAEAVATARAAATAIPEGSPDRPRVLSNLAAVLSVLYRRTGETAVLAEAVTAAQVAVSSTPAGHRLRAGLMAAFADTLHALFKRTGDTETLSKAVAAAQAAVLDTPADDPYLPGRLSNLCACLMSQFEGSGDVGALAEAAQTARTAVAAAPPGHVHRPACLSALGDALETLAGRTDDRALLAEAIDQSRMAVAAALPGHPDRAAHLVNLGGRLRRAFDRSGDPAAMTEAVSTLTEAAEDDAAPTWTRIDAGRLLGTVPDEQFLSAHDRLAAIESAVDLLPRVSSRVLARDDRQHAAGRLASLAGEAAAAAVAAGQPGRAVELLEQTRGLLVAEALDSRSLDLDQLRRADPKLARSFEQLRDQVEFVDGRGAVAPALESGLDDQRWAQDLRLLAEQRRTLHAEWDDLIARIRSVRGLETFLRPPGLAELTAQASGGPVVFVYTSSLRCDALILTSDSGDPVRAVPLSALTDGDARTQSNRFIRAQDRLAANAHSTAAAKQDLVDVLAWLWDSTAAPVLTELGYLAPPEATAAWPRVWWCPVGVLALMPLHAAGHHTRHDPASRTVLDRVISSYTTTVRAMAYSRGHLHEPAQAAVLIAAPDIPGVPPLRGAAAEVASLAKLLPNALTLPRPTRQQVLAVLPEHGIAHFACHGVVDYADPARSRLVLYDDDTAPLTAADIGSLRLPHASLAYLSACSTSVTTLALADEALHLAGAFQLAGFRHVIATLWPVGDRAAATMTREFYEQLTAGDTKQLEIAGSAGALHRAARSMRDKDPGNILAWAAHTHTGQ